ncbi:MAG: TolC family protein, partial [Gemmatimonadota bacterium]
MTNRRNVLKFFLMLSSVLLPYTQTLADLPVVNIGVVIDGPWERNDEIRTLFQREILELTRREFDVRFPGEKRLEADWTAAGVQEAIERLLTDSEVDLILALGVIASDDVCRRGELPKPVIAPFVIDRELQDILLKDGASGITNLNYVSLPSTIKTDIEAFLEIVPFRKLVILISRPYYEAIEAPRKNVPRVMEALSLEYETVSVDKTVDQALSSIPQDAEAVYVIPMTHLPSREFDKLVAGLIERKLPSFSFLGRSEVERGIMAGLKSEILPKIARRVALNTQRILLGEEPGSIPVSFAPRSRLTINRATSRAIGVDPPWAVLTEADVIKEERVEIERELDMYKAVQEAIAANLDLAVQKHVVAAGEQEVKSAWANLLPQVDVSGLGLVIDKDRAEASFGQQAERTLSGSVTATQVIFSESAWANVSIQKNLQRTREQQLEQLRLDIIQSAATAYLNVLKAKTIEQIQKENLKQTRSHLELARVREMVGSAGPAEVYRWESEIATNRKKVIESNSQRNLTEIDLNRLLHRPAEEAFRTKEADFEAPGLLSAEERLIRYLGDPQSFRVFRAFAVEEGFLNSPELLSLDAAIAAQQRVVSSATNSFWAPTVALQGEVDHIFSRSGVGSESGLSLIPSLPERDDTDWSVGLNVSFPLFEG